jgi:hypothetical protein
MEAKCDGCGRLFSPSVLRVSKVGDDYRFICWSEDTQETCRRPGKPILVSYLFPWAELLAVRAYLEGEISGEILGHVDEFKANVDHEMLNILRRVIKKDDS